MVVVVLKVVKELHPQMEDQVVVADLEMLLTLVKNLLVVVDQVEKVVVLVVMVVQVL
jgi:hypothetical protein